ncbi:MAG TPA: thiamine pyrophosphate-binding protein [Terriglobales bacterium]|jgi:acetolactate synthase-1/2/3 large subunit|nr:thiamine pyrophosphate-binding protein [Terriglobales bacterium]
MSKMTGGDIVVRALEDEGVPFTFGIPGTHNIELYDSLARSTSVRPVLVTDEQSASFMADGVARASGQLAAVNVVPGAGLTHALSGIAEAYLDGIPMLVLACGIRRDTGRAFQLHDVDQLAIARPVTKAQLRAEHGSEIYATIRRACQIARSAPAGPALVEIPAEHYFFRHDACLEAPNPQPAAPATHRELVERACQLIEASRRPLLYIGSGAVEAGADLVALAERLNAPVATTIAGKGVFNETHPLWLWCGFGAAAPSFVRKIAASCDLTLAIGCRFSEVGTGSYGMTPPGKLIHVDIDPSVLGKNYPADLPIVSDAASFVASLLPHLKSRAVDESLRRDIRSGHEEVKQEWKTPKNSEGVYPPHLLETIQRLVGNDSIYTTDSGNGTFLAMECLRLQHSRSFLAPVDYSCMGYAVPAALGAALACPDRQVISLAGDGAFLMTGLELLTARQLNLPVMVLVLRDRELAQIAQFQQIALGRKTCSELPDYDLSAICRGVGVEYLALRRNADAEAILKQALTVTGSGHPVVVEVAIDYSEKTYFTRGVVRTNLGRLPWPDRIRFVLRALGRKLG